MADLHHSKHAILLSSSLTTPKPTFMVKFAVVAMLYQMPQAKSGEIVGYRYYVCYLLEVIVHII